MAEDKKAGAPKAGDKKDAPAGPHRVTAKPESFWRAGLRFTREAREFKAGELTVGQVEALKAEPMLVVEEL